MTYLSQTQIFFKLFKIFSLDPLDDSQIDQLMKDESLKRAADDIFRATQEHAEAIEAGDSKAHP